ncbi:MAG: hypothetical protein JSU70_03835 [Phycisphaerales bacterium]|nr:MAG: hypothetical protein JSU70_03835 [Phycisphaerales bacterium]
MLAGLWPMLLAYGSLLVSVTLAVTGTAIAQGLQTNRVAEIRFGVIEPPVVAQRDITVRARISNQQLEQKPLECSGIVWIADKLLISSDRHNHIVFTCPVDLQNMIIGEATPHVVVRNEQELLQDAECITTRRDENGQLHVYMMCSLSNDPDALPLPKRRHMLRFGLRNPDSLSIWWPVVLNGGTIRDSTNGYFKAIGVEPYRTFNSAYVGADKNTYRWGNIEGMCFTPDGSAVLLGMRNPLCGSSALVVVVQGMGEAFAAGNTDGIQIVDMFAVGLGERGISDLCWDPLTRGYLIAAAKSNGPKLNKDQPYPPNTLDSALFWWSGRKQERPILFAKLPDMKIEAVCRLGPTRFIAIGTDEGDVSEGRTLQQQSVITIIYFTGVETPSGQ